jgi:hypothetical protein
MLDKSKIVVYIIDVNQKKQTGDRTDGYPNLPKPNFPSN